MKKFKIVGLVLCILATLTFNVWAKDPVVIATDDAPAAIGPYSQAIEYGGLLFISGQIALDSDGQMVADDIVTQTEQVMENLGAILAAAGMGFDDALKVTVFLGDLSDFAAFNVVYESFFGDSPPAREVVGAEIPRGSRLEVSLIAGK